MTSATVTAAAPRAARLPLVRSALASELAAIGVLAVASCALIALTWQTWGDIGQDTGYDLVAGAFVSHGHMPYVDFTYYYGAGAPLLAGLAALLGGTGLMPAVVLGLVLTLGVVAATYVLARTQVEPWGATAAALVTAAVAFAPTNLSYVLPHSLSATLAVLLGLLFCLAASRYASTGRTGALLAAGFAVGLTSLTRPEFELAVIVASVVWLALRTRAGLGGRREWLVLGLPAALVPAVAYGAFLAQGVSLHQLLFDNLYPTRVLHAGGNTIIRTQAPLTPGSVAHVVGESIAYAAGALVLVAIGMLAVSRRRALRFCAIALAVIAAIGAAADLEAARHGLQYVYGWIPVGAAVLVVALVVRRLRAREAAWTADSQTQLVIGLVLAVLAAKTYAVFYLESTVTQPAVYAAPFAAILLARLHLRDLSFSRGAVVAGAAWLAFLAAVGIALTVKDANAKSATISGPGGTIATAPADAPMYRAALREITARTAPGDPILVAPQLTLLYTLSGRTDPLRDISLLPGAPGTVAAERASIARLDREHVRLVLVDRVRLTEYGHGAFGSSYDTTLGAWIHRTFKHVKTLSAIGGRSKHQIDVFVRRSP